MNEVTPEYQIIETEAELEALAGRLAGKKKIGIDLEADSMYHFKEKVCLLQISTGKKSFVVDTLKLTDLSVLKPIFANSGIKKILHGADYHIRSLYRDFGIEISNMLDTQLASRFLGVRQTGLDAIIRDRFGIVLDKKYQKKDWSVRPLPQEMLEYAAQDVVFLVELGNMLIKDLKDKGRLSWVREECLLLSKVRYPETNGLPLYMKIKGFGQLKMRNLAVLESLLQFRKSVAEIKDRPVFKILSNESLVQLAISKPENLSQLEKENILSRKQISMYGKEIIDAIRKGVEFPSKDLNIIPQRKPLALSSNH